MGTVTHAPTDPHSLAKTGRILELLTILWGATEAAVAITAARRSHSVSLAGFGLDSVIEVISACALMWRMSHETDHHRRHRAEHRSLRIAGICLLALAAYVLVDSLHSLLHHESQKVSWLGIGITLAALICMPLLARAKKRVGRALHSGAMLTDARQTDFCSYQAGIVLIGVASQRWFGWYWMDAVAGLLLVPIILRASWLSFQGKSCCNH